mgnify:FL=1
MHAADTYLSDDESFQHFHLENKILYGISEYRRESRLKHGEYDISLMWGSQV